MLVNKSMTLLPDPRLRSPRCRVVAQIDAEDGWATHELVCAERGEMPGLLWEPCVTIEPAFSLTRRRR